MLTEHRWLELSGNLQRPTAFGVFPRTPGVALISEDNEWRRACSLALQETDCEAHFFLTPWQFEQFKWNPLPVILLLDQSFRISCEDQFTGYWLEQTDVMRVVILAEAPSTRSVVGAMKAGAAAVLSKPVSVEGIRREIQEIADTISGNWGMPGESGGRVRLRLLTDRQRSVAELIYAGKSNREIAELLSIAVKTVESHRNQIMRKLGLNSVAALIRLIDRAWG